MRPVVEQATIAAQKAQPYNQAFMRRLLTRYLWAVPPPPDHPPIVHGGECVASGRIDSRVKSFADAVVVGGAAARSSSDDSTNVNALLRLGLVAGLIAALASPAVAKRHGKSHRAASPSPHKPSDAEVEAATRLQVFLDRANFSPGKIDGHYNEVTLKALALYRQSRGEPVAELRSQKQEGGNQPPLATASPSVGGQKVKSRATDHEEPTPAKPDASPDLSGIDLASVNPVFIQYTVTDADMKNIGPVPRGESAAVAAAKAKLPALPYRDVGQEIAKKFHVDQKFLGELNPGKNGTSLKPGDQLRVPNVEPFDLEAVKNLKPGSELTA